MADLLTHAQIVMLAQTLGVSPDRLSHFEHLGADNVRALRERMSALLFDAHAETFRRVSGLGPLVPAALVAKVAQVAIPPLVGGLAGGALGVDHPDKAAGVLSRLSADYMADAAPYLDPRTLKVLAPVVPAGPLIPAAKELLRRRDYVTASRFIEFATPELIRAFESALDDDEGVLRVAAYTHSADRLSEIVRMLPEARVSSIIKTGATGSSELRLATISLVSRIDDELKRQAGDILFDGLESAALSGFLETVLEEGAVAELLTLTAQLSPAALDMAAANSVLTAPSTVETLVKVAAERRLWHGLLDVVERAGSDVQRHAVGVLEQLPGDALSAVAETATERHLWPVLLRILAGHEPQTQTRIGGTWRRLKAVKRTALRDHIRDLGLQDELQPLRDALK